MAERKSARKIGQREALFGIATLIVLALIGLTYSCQLKYAEHSDQRSREHAKHANEQIAQACRGVPNAQLVGCFAEARVRSELQKQQYRHDEADLVAQQTSALWTGVMGIAALIGMALSAVGVALVFFTFRETKHANLLNMRENARATRRAVAGARETAEALAAANKTAEGATGQVEVAQNTAYRELRAYIGVSVYISMVGANSSRAD